MEALALALIGLGVVVVVVVLAIPTTAWLHERRRRRTPPIHPDSEVLNVPTFRVIALGLEGAGKTVLLASQARKLLPAADRRYHLASGLEQNRLLAKLHSEVRNTSAPWPPATRIGDTRDFLFDCKASDRTHQQRIVFRITYLDYPGEILEPSDVSTATTELETRVDDAQALLLILDGRRVLQLLRDEREGHDYFDERLWPMLDLGHRATCPVQLIITKWDLVRAYNAPMEDDDLLRQVSRRLMAHVPAIKQLVYVHCQRAEEVRLIPVSAVGSQFAELNDDGTVSKRADGMLDPINVDVPLCAVIPDLLKRVERSLEPSVRRELDDAIDRAPVGDVASIAVSVLDSRVGLLLRNALAVVVGDAVVKLFVELLVRSKSPEAQPPRDNGDDEAVTQRLRAEVIGDMERVVEQFEDRLPSSILCRRQ